MGCCQCESENRIHHVYMMYICLKYYHSSEIFLSVSLTIDGIVSSISKKKRQKTVHIDNQPKCSCVEKFALQYINTFILNGD